MPLLKNGITPEDQTILTVLEEITERVDEDGWQLRRADTQQKFFVTTSTMSLYRLSYCHVNVIGLTQDG